MARSLHLVTTWIVSNARVCWPVLARGAAIGVGMIGLWGCVPSWPPLSVPMPMSRPATTVVDLRAIAQSRPLRILPLGDSITEGYDVPGGYRIRLCAQLDAWSDRHGLPSVEWVGSLQHGPPELRDRNHEGHSGWRIDQLQAEIAAWLATARPDVVLLLIGTNDVVQAYDLARAPERLNQLITTIQAQQPGVWLVVATLPPMDATILNLGDPAQLQAEVDRYNQAVRRLVGDRAARGEAIALVELAEAVDLADLPDGVHPNRIGHDKIADAWFSALMPHLDR